ncbi:hypothetical protein FQA47_019492 [Oryzias melastigma]|uniref:Uncharacterized protein n=1 Tax=Oryzias melastigma TaxID=30732 RepID=A0A834F7A4_ORYME|nr:hypothetical protein FQA47_019492 [Oryzias melastigma]
MQQVLECSSERRTAVTWRLALGGSGRVCSSLPASCTPWTKRRTKQCYCVYFPCHVVVLPTWNQKWEREHLVCFGFYKKMKKTPIQINSVAFSFSRLKMSGWESEALSVPELVCFSSERFCCEPYHFIVMEIKEVLVHSPTLLLLMFFQFSGRSLMV